MKRQRNTTQMKEQRFYKWFVMALSEMKTNIQK